jgi:hypothetical protein
MKADDPSKEGVVALGLSVAMPMGTLGNRSSSGFGGSLSCEWALKEKHGIRARLEIAKFGNKTFDGYQWSPNYPPDKLEGKANAAVGILDYVHRFVSHDSGFFVFIGVGYGNISVEPDSDWQGQSISGSGTCYSAGVGFNFTKNFGIEASAIAAAPYNPSGSGINIYTWQQISIKFRL